MPEMGTRLHHHCAGPRFCAAIQIPRNPAQDGSTRMLDLARQALKVIFSAVILQNLEVVELAIKSELQNGSELASVILTSSTTAARLHLRSKPWALSMGP